VLKIRTLFRVPIETVHVILVGRPRGIAIPNNLTSMRGWVGGLGSCLSTFFRRQRRTQAWWYNSQIDYRGTNSQTGVFRQSKTA